MRLIVLQVVVDVAIWIGASALGVVFYRAGDQ
jgi:hypothetical protein